jgi:hypothetical protein
MLERVTRLWLALSAATAVVLQAYLGARASAHLLQVDLTLFAVALVTSRWQPRAARWLVLLPAYLFPAIVLTTLHGFNDACWSVWTALVAGYVLGRAPLARWALPSRWRWPLSLWGLSIAVSWPLIAWREIDFTPAQLDRYTTGVTNIGISPAAEVLWIANVAATHLLGILWIDALYREEAASGPRAAPAFVTPLLVSALGSAGVALYQMFGRMEALNDTIFGTFHRASGAMVDANAFGIIAALWLAGAIAVAAGAVDRWIRIGGSIVAVVLGLGVWGSGSQSALLLSALVGAGALYGVWRLPQVRRAPGAGWVAALAVVAVVAGAVVVNRGGSSAVGPVARLQMRWNQAMSGGPNGLANVLWQRDGYGTAATAMIQRFPLTGVGVGMFNSLVVDESELIGLGPSSPDNAQNWFRHQLAEMGLLGCVGWIVWLVFYLPALRRPAETHSSALGMYVLRAALVGLGLVSLIGMPTQNAAALVTFWSFVFWHDRLTVRADDERRPMSGSGWLVAAVIVASYAAVISYVGHRDLRVPVRAATLGWPYDHGLYDLEKPPRGPAFRWTSAHAVLTVVAPATPGKTESRYLPVTFWANHPDLSDRPLHVRIRINGRVDIDEMITDSRPVTRYFKLAPDERGVMIETWVDRTWRPAEAGERDGRELGVALADLPLTCCPPDSGSIVG